MVKSGENYFQRIGGMAQVKALANEFYDVMESNQTAKPLRELHPKKLISTRKIMYRFLTHWLGGPKIFNDAYTNGNWLELRHSSVPLDEDKIEQWLYCMNTAMDNLQYEETLKQDLLNIFKDMIDSMRAIRGQEHSA